MKQNTIRSHGGLKLSLLTTLILQLFIATLSASQTDKVPLTHDVYDGWNNLFRQQISPDGRWVTWEVNPQDGDGWLYLKDLRNNVLDSIARGTRAEFSPNSDYMAFYISPPKAIIRQAKVDGLSADEMPQDSVGIYVFARASNSRHGSAGRFALAREESSWMVYLVRERTAKPRAPAGNNSPGSEESRKTIPLTMVVFNPVTGEKYEFTNIDQYSLSRNGTLVVFSSHSSVIVFNTVTRTTTRIFESPGKAGPLTTNSDGSRAAFLFSRESQGNPDIYDLWYWQEGTRSAFPAVTSTTRGMPEGWSASEHGNIRFSVKGDRLYFGTAEKPQQEPKDTLLEEEKYSLDIWHYRDPLIQPQQLVELSSEQKRTYTAVYHADEHRMVQLACPELPEVTTLQSSNGRVALGTSTMPYRIQNSFESGNYADIYLVDVTTGERRKVLEKHRGSTHLSELGDARLSPEGKYLLWYSQADSNWHAMPTRINNHDQGPAAVGSRQTAAVGGNSQIAKAGGSAVRSTRSSSGHSAVRSTSLNITAGIPRPLYNELHDQPGVPGPYGVGTWTEGDRHVLIYDRYDIWKVDPQGIEKPVNLTGGYGRANNIRLRYVNPCPEKKSPEPRERIMLSAFHLCSKQSGFYTVRMHRPGNPSELTMDDARYFTPQKAAESNVIIWRKSTFTEFPDLWVSNMNFRRAEKISRANPQQSRYRWGRAQQAEWVSLTNDSLQGILYTPEILEPGRKYPMIVYFYERGSDNLHAHYVPSPSRSVINISYCVSNGYVVFVPDIPYTVGYPGQSAYNAIVSGTMAMIERHDFIDRHNVGIQGQSWAGYQIAWLITQTDLFRAAMAGAPVTNMISAYGGIRWATGLSRIYQYEETQSRIGGTLWEMPHRYLENSPIFFADKVSTPLLMMHNDRDGAVPWYQGIEFYMALRRLEKPVWMLSYNDEGHNLTRRPNMMDLSVRMYQFFNHYLKGSPPPSWMVHGIPATEKGMKDGYELVN